MIKRYKMNNEQKLDQILENQRTIMTFLHYGLNNIRTDEILGDALNRRNEETNKLLDLNIKEVKNGNKKNNKKNRI